MTSAARNVKGCLRVKASRGYTDEEFESFVLATVHAELFRGRSPMRYRPQDRPTGSTTKATGATVISFEWAWLKGAREREVGLAARLLGPSCAGSHLDRLMREAPLRCPGCGGKGVWTSWGCVDPHKGIQQTADQRARPVKDTLEAGQSMTGTDVGDRPLVAAGDDVWLCASCGHWTREPLALMTSERADDLSVLPGHGSPGGRDVGADGRLLAYVDGRLSLLDEEAARDYLDAMTGGIACDYEDAWIEQMDQRRLNEDAAYDEAMYQRRCRDAEESEAEATPSHP